MIITLFSIGTLLQWNLQKRTPLYKAHFPMQQPAIHFHLQKRITSLYIVDKMICPSFRGSTVFNSLSSQQSSELELMRRQMLDVPLLFAVVSQEYMNMRRPSSEQSSHQISVMSQIYDQLCRFGYLNDVSPNHSPSPIAPHDPPDTNPELSFNFIPVDTIVTNFLDFTPELLSFVQCNMRQQITSAASSLHDAHARCLQMLILYAHDLTRDVLVTPKRIKYARTKEEELYTQLIDLASKKQGEIKELVHTAIAAATEDVVAQVIHLEFDDSYSLDSSYQAPDQKTAKKCVIQVHVHVHVYTIQYKCHIMQCTLLYMYMCACTHTCIYMYMGTKHSGG